MNVRGSPAATICALGILLCGGCSKDPFRPAGPPPIPFTPDLDNEQAWSRDGKTIAFHRRLPSQYGPAGAYLIPSGGGDPQFLISGDFVFPEDLSFSRDDRFVAMNRYFRLVIVDRQTGAVEFASPESVIVMWPEWSPTGDSLVYRGPGGFYIYNARTKQAWPLLINGEQVGGNNPRWAPDGRRIAYVGYEVDRGISSIRVIAVDGTENRIVYEGRYDVPDVMGWYVDPLRDETWLLFEAAELGRLWTFAVGPDGSDRHRFRRKVLPSDAFSPDFRWVVTLDFDRAAIPVLFVVRTEDIAKAGERQLTSYTRP